MASDPPEHSPSATVELVQFVGRLALVTAFALAIALAPAVPAILIHPWAGVPTAIGSFWVWGRFGPRPQPGFLPGILCLMGVAAILGSMVACVIFGFRN